MVLDRKPQGGSFIVVGNVSPNVSKDTLHKFFSSAGKVIDVQPKSTSPGGSCQFMVCFEDPEAAHNAYATRNGVSLGGSKVWLGMSDRGGAKKDFLASTPSSQISTPPFSEVDENFPEKFRQKAPYGFKGEFASSKTTEGRNCNLYVLNLSLNMTNTSLKEIMAENGAVKHVCVLATLDNAGRRRAFVDMSTPEEARLVIQRLHGKRIEGYELNISYAFIQRSGGPGVPLDKTSTPSLYDQRRPSQNQVLTRSISSRKVQEHGIRKAPKNFGLQSSHSDSPKNYSYPSIAKNSSRTELKEFPNGFDGTYAQAQFQKLPNPIHLDIEKADGEFDGSSCNLFESALQDGSRQQSPNALAEVAKDPTLLVSNLSPVACIDSDDLYKLFLSQGISGLKFANLDIDHHTGMSLGCGTLGFETMEELEKAYHLLSNKELILDGVKVICEYRLSGQVEMPGETFKSLKGPGLASAQILPELGFHHHSYSSCSGSLLPGNTFSTTSFPHGTSTF